MIIDAATAEVIRAMAPGLRAQLPRWRDPATIEQVARAAAEQPRTWYPGEAVRLARMVVEELGLNRALALANEEFPPDPADALFKRYRDEYEAGQDPDAAEYMRAAHALDQATTGYPVVTRTRHPQVLLMRVGGHGMVRAVLTAMIGVYLEYAPQKELTPEQYAEARARIDPLIDQIETDHEKRRAMGFDDDSPVAE